MSGAISGTSIESAATTRPRRIAGRTIAALVLALAAVVAVHETTRFVADAWTEAGLRRFREGKFESALEAYDRALALDPQSIEARFRRGGAYSSLAAIAADRGDDDQARRFRHRAAADLEIVARLAPNHANVSWRLGVVRAELGLDAEAVPLLREAMRRDPDAPGGFELLARSLERVGDGAEAARAAEAAARRDPWNASIHEVAARAARRLGERREATDLLRDAIACAPRDPSPRLLRAAWLFEDGDVDAAYDDAFVAAFRGGASALDRLRVLLERRSDDARSAFVLAVATRKAGDEGGAMPLYDRHREKVGARADSRQVQASRLAAAGDRSGAGALLDAVEAEAVARLVPESLAEHAKAIVLGTAPAPGYRDPETKRRFAVTLLRFGRSDLALPLLEEIVRDDPFTVLWRLVLAEESFRAGRLDEAESLARTCVERGFGGYRLEEDPFFAEEKRVEDEVGLRLFRLSTGAEAIDLALSRAPRDPRAHYRGGLLSLAASDRERADRFFADAARLDPSNLLAVDRLRDRPGALDARVGAIRALGVRARRLLARVLGAKGDASTCAAEDALADREADAAGIPRPASIPSREVTVASLVQTGVLGSSFDLAGAPRDGAGAGAWWLGRTADVRIDLAEPAREVIVRLAAPGLAPIRQWVVARIGGREAARGDIGPEIVSLKVPLGDAPTRSVRLFLEATVAISPWEWTDGASPDRRPLAALVSSLEFR